MAQHTSTMHDDATTQVVCQRCDGSVRVPTDRLPDAPKCPRCHEPLFDGHPLNTDEAQDIAGRYGIRSIPTLMVFKDGREVARQAGAMDAASLRRWLATALR